MIGADEARFRVVVGDDGTPALRTNNYREALSFARKWSRDNGLRQAYVRAGALSVALFRNGVLAWSKCPDVTLSDRELEAVREIAGNGRDGGISVPRLARALETSSQGAAKTASSLVRKGLAERLSADVLGYVTYWPTRTGLDVASVFS